MIHKLQCNDRRIQRIGSATKLAKEEVLKLVDIEPSHLSEKNNWYRIDGKLEYFKIRKDCRLIGELLSKALFEAFDRPCAQYQISYMKGKGLGLLSPNIQKEGYAYYDVTRLPKLYPELPRRYGTYSLRAIFDVLEYYGIPEYQNLVTDLVTIYVLDWFSNQGDRNPKNLLFEKSKATPLQVATMMDSEISFGIVKHDFDDEYPKLWVPSIPYKHNIAISQRAEEEGYNPTILELLKDYPKLVVDILTRLQTDLLHNEIERFRKSRDSDVYLESEGVDFLHNFVEKQKKLCKTMISIPN